MSSRILLLLIVLIILAVFFLARQIPGRLSAGHELVARSRPFSVDRGQNSFRILIAGDSTAVGTGVADLNQSIAGRLARDFPRATITNLGENGLRTGEVADRLAVRGSERADLILLQTGGNDILH